MRKIGIAIATILVVVLFPTTSNVASAQETFRWLPGDAILYQGSRMEFVETNASGQTWFDRKYDDGRLVRELSDSNGNLLARIKARVTQQFVPNNATFPIEPLRLGMSWAGTYSINASTGQVVYRSKSCTVTSISSYALPGLQSVFAAYHAECTNTRSDRRSGADETFTFIELGGHRIIVAYQSLEFAKRLSAIGFLRASD